ncbi:uncharacterized protein LOC141857673 isoform X2 [Brevipalpus obovatus]|uniref:uncharacterized protein LOC141857673 isoform X2 n=1 Tax=Brevipalpus obovatus TaxID=246614 RepID=UPI003D9F82A9
MLCSNYSPDHFHHEICFNVNCVSQWTKQLLIIAIYTLLLTASVGKSFSIPQPNSNLRDGANVGTYQSGAKRSSYTSTTFTTLSTPEMCPKIGRKCTKKDFMAMWNETGMSSNPQTEQDMNKLCSLLNKSMNCLKYIIKCGDDSLPDALKQLESISDNLCSKNSKFRRDYLKHASCFDYLKPVYNECQQLGQEAETQRKMISEERRISPEDDFRLHCCNVHYLRNCSTPAVSIACGKHAVELAERIMVMWDGNNPASRLCGQYVPDYSFCTELWKKLSGSPNFTYIFDPHRSKLNYSSILPHPSKTSSYSSSSAVSLWTLSSSQYAHLILAMKVMFLTLIEFLLCWQFSLSSSSSSLLFPDNHHSPKAPSPTQHPPPPTPPPSPSPLPSLSLSANQYTSMKHVMDPGR